MANYESVVRRPGSVAQADIDEGLRAYMNKVYSLMGVAMLITGVVAYVFGNDLYAVMNGQETAIIPESVLVGIFATPVKWAIMFGPLLFAMFFERITANMSVSGTRMAFIFFSAFMGVSLSSIFAVFTGMSIATAFFMAAIMFLSLSLIGYTTKRDLGPMGMFLTMGLVGLIVASLVNFSFIESSMFKLLIDVVILLVVAGLTAFYTQALKNQYLHLAQMGREGALALEKGAIGGALSLYIMFLNMFIILVQLVGVARE